MKDYYEILKVKKGTPKKKIESAYTELIKKYDINNYEGEAKKLVESQIKDINEAYSVLSDDILRQKYEIEFEKENIASKKVKKNKKEFKDKNVEELEENEEDQELQEDVFDEKKSKKQKREIGTFNSMVNLTKMTFSNLPKFKFDTSKESIIALVLAILIIGLLILILYFLPFTHDFVKNFFLLN